MCDFRQFFIFGQNSLLCQKTNKYALKDWRFNKKWIFFSFIPDNSLIKYTDIINKSYDYTFE